jgi:hypothetical protein
VNSALIHQALAPVSIRIVAGTMVTLGGHKMHLFAEGTWVVGMQPWVNRWTVSSGCRSSGREAGLLVRGSLREDGQRALVLLN